MTIFLLRLYLDKSILQHALCLYRQSDAQRLAVSVRPVHRTKFAQLYPRFDLFPTRRAYGVRCGVPILYTRRRQKPPHRLRRSCYHQTGKFLRRIRVLPQRGRREEGDAATAFHGRASGSPSMQWRDTSRLYRAVGSTMSNAVQRRSSKVGSSLFTIREEIGEDFGTRTSSALAPSSTYRHCSPTCSV